MQASTIKRLAWYVLLVAVAGCTTTIDHRKVIITEKMQMDGWQEDHPGQALYRVNFKDVQFWADEHLFTVGDTLEFVRRRNGN